MHETESLTLVERILATHPAFGRSEYIHRQLHIAYLRRLDRIAVHSPAAAALSTALHDADDERRYHVLGDTVVRCAIQRARRQLESGTDQQFTLDQCEDAFIAATLHLKNGCGGGPLQSGLPNVHRLGPSPWHGWIWSEDHADDVFGRLFRYVVKENYTDSLCTPTDAEREHLARGAQLLDTLLPSLSRSALSHAHTIAVFPAIGGWAGKASSSQFRISGTIFINREALGNPWWIAEHLLHESLHQKLYDFRHGHSLLACDSTPDHESTGADSPRVCSLWNMPGRDRSNYWDTHRVIAAFHVYVHLALLCTLAEQRAPELETIYGRRQGALSMTSSRKALERAHYLGDQLKEICWQDLGLAGQRLTDWLCSVVDALDPSPPPPGAHMHLLLDRFQTEATRVEYVLSAIGGDRGTREGTEAALTELMGREVDSTRRILLALSADADLSRFDDTVAQCSAEPTPGVAFSRVRRLISHTLLTLSPDGYEFGRPSTQSVQPERIVEQMIEGSSQSLERILAT